VINSGGGENGGVEKKKKKKKKKKLEIRKASREGKIGRNKKDWGQEAKQNRKKNQVIKTEKGVYQEGGKGRLGKLRIRLKQPNPGQGG